MGKTPVKLPIERIKGFCRSNGIKRLALFGSVLRDDFRAGSDVDVVVEFKPGVRTGFRFFGMEAELSALLGRRVDLNTPDCLSPYSRDRVLAEAEVVYDET